MYYKLLQFVLINFFFKESDSARSKFIADQIIAHGETIVFLHSKLMASPPSSLSHVNYWLERAQGAWRDVTGRMIELTPLVTDDCARHQLIRKNMFAEYNKKYMKLEHLLITNIMDKKEQKGCMILLSLILLSLVFG